ncbi:MAG: beta-ketoacyl reductase [Pseudomonadota bacterium]
MVLEDAQLSTQDDAAIDRIVRAKVLAAIHLDRLTKPLNPRYFVLYGSVAAAIGNPGQAAYSAANAALGGLARKRRREGLPAVVLGWGPIKDAGYLARDRGLRTRLSGTLGGLTRARDALEVLGRVLAEDNPPPVLYYASIPWGRLAERLPSLRAPFYRALADDKKTRRNMNDDVAGLDFERLDDAEAVPKLLHVLTQTVADVLRQSDQAIDPHKPLLELGLDSLMSVDLKLALEDRLGRTLPAIALDGEVTLSELSRQVLRMLRTGRDDEEHKQDRELETLIQSHVDRNQEGVSPELVEQILARTEGGGRS